MTDLMRRTSERGARGNGASVMRLVLKGKSEQAIFFLQCKSRLHTLILNLSYLSTKVLIHLILKSQYMNTLNLYYN